MRKTLLSIVAMLSLAVPTMNAQLSEFFDGGMPEKLFTVGVRTGVNISNLSDNRCNEIPNIMHAQNQWKAGFSLGAVVDINIRNFLVLQPGFFLQTRNHGYNYMMVDFAPENNVLESKVGERSSTYFQVPILASLRKDFTEDIQVQVDFGPYFLYGLGGEDEYKYLKNGNGSNLDGRYIEEDYFGKNGAVRGFDWGFKFGAGVVIMKHYYVGAHYEAGCRNVLKTDTEENKNYSGHNKAWNFTVGYNF